MNRTNDLQLEALVADLRRLAEDFGKREAEGQSYRLLAEAVAKEIAAAAGEKESYASARQAIQEHQRLAALLHSTLDEMLATLDRLEQARLRREKYSELGVAQALEVLKQVFEKDPEAGFRKWLAAYAQALVDWELESCGRLASASLPFPSEQIPYVLLVRHGDISLHAGDWIPALPMLDYLVGRLSDSTAEDERLLGALISIFNGRIHLLQANSSAADLAFERACNLAPGDGRPLAAKGEASLARGNAGWADANRLFSRAIEHSPDQPEGHVGKALLAEARQQWSEADKWYDDAIQAALDEADLLHALSKMLAPGSGRLYLHVARRLREDGVLDRALAAVERSLELKWEDGTENPLRPAMALKAEIALDSSGPDLPPEEARRIADLFLEAGKHYHWNNEVQAAVDLLRKAQDLDGRNPETLFYLADSLRTLSHKSTAPFYTSEEVVRESLDLWLAGMALTERVDTESAWIYVARCEIEKQAARLPGEVRKDHYWQAIVHNEQALLLGEHPSWWRSLSHSYNEMALYGNMEHVSRKAAAGAPDDVLILEERAKVLLNTGRFDSVQEVLDQLMEHPGVEPRSKLVYLTWQAFRDHCLGRFQEALDNLRPYLDQVPDDLWTISLRSEVYRAMGNDEEARKDAEWVWNHRTDPRFKDEDISFFRAALQTGRIKESLELAKPFLESGSADERFDASLVSGLGSFILGDTEAAERFLERALALSTNRRTALQVIRDLESVLQ
ncbi:MAG TPA: hypothetical protein VFR31_16075, partial [Thermoanaerobaculia bacterium]|nr:hypothetical protein [Thermoanaerobaculia bacterium]